jgi:DNA-binding CsgD family transcriptional regulator
VLLLMPDRTAGRSFVRALQQATIAVDWVRTIADLDARTKRSSDAVPVLVLVVPSQNERLDPRTLADLAMRLFAEAATEAVAVLPEALPETLPETREWRQHLREAFRAYCAHRALSPRQRRVLALYLTGSNDKEMAGAFGCSEATVYEHWRRMARKASGAHKWDVVTDFHRFLAGGATAADATNGHDGNGDDGNADDGKE